jgi:hypothetical protein
MLLWLVVAGAVGCTGAIQYQPPAATGQGQPIDGWMEYKLGTSYAEIKEVLNTHGLTLTPVRQISGLDDAVALLKFLDTTPASSEALILPEDMATGTRSVLVFGYDIGGEVPRDAVVLELVFNRTQQLQAVHLLFRPVSGFNLEDYAHSVIVPHLDERYRRATGWAPGRVEKIIARWIDPRSENQIALFGINKPSPNGILVLSYSAPGVAKGVLNGPVF